MTVAAVARTMKDSAPNAPRILSYRPTALRDALAGSSAPRAVLAGEYAFDGKVFVEIRPMQAEGRHLNIVELCVWLAFQARVTGDWKGNFEAAVHPDVDLCILMKGGNRLINQCAHSRA